MAFLPNSSIGPSDWDLVEVGAQFYVSQIVGEPTLVALNKPSHDVMLFGGEPTVLEGLERLTIRIKRCCSRNASLGPIRLSWQRSRSL
jgi:hypothetical protein